MAPHPGTYALNGLGQRVRKTTSGTSIYFVYDKAGHQIGEYDGSGNLIQETVWFEEIPLFCARFPRICKEMARCAANPAACRAKFCRAGNRLYHPMCDWQGCKEGEGCATTTSKVGLFEGCYANRLAVSRFCGKRTDPQHERERAIAWQKGQECLRVLPINCKECLPGS